MQRPFHFQFTVPERLSTEKKKTKFFGRQYTEKPANESSRLSLQVI
jgi:hypothetical protein